MKRVKKNTYSGCVCETVVFSVPERADVRKYKKRVRFKTDEEYEEFKDSIGKRKFAQMVNANHDPSSFKGTLTFDDAHELHEFSSARLVRAVYVRRLRRMNPSAKIIIVMGRGETTSRIHFHYIINGLTETQIRRAWTWGEIVECKPLREHNRYDGVDHGRDYTALAFYYWGHWTVEQGGHHYYATRNHVKPEAEDAVEIKREYSVERPPRAPKGYILVEAKDTPFGYVYFKFVLDVKIQKRRSPLSHLR